MRLSLKTLKRAFLNIFHYSDPALVFIPGRYILVNETVDDILTSENATGLTPCLIIKARLYTTRKRKVALTRRRRSRKKGHD